MAGNMGLLGNVFQMQLVLLTDSTFKTSFRSSGKEIRIKYLASYRSENEAIESPRKTKKSLNLCSDKDTLKNY
jgi:hypothetical protein